MENSIFLTQMQPLLLDYINRPNSSQKVKKTGNAAHTRRVSQRLAPIHSLSRKIRFRHPRHTIRMYQKFSNPTVPIPPRCRDRKKEIYACFFSRQSVPGYQRCDVDLSLSGGV